MIPVRQSTAFECSIGPVLDADGVAVTGGVVGDLKIKKTTGNYAALNASATLTHVSAGVYDLVLTTSDTDTVGLATIAMDDGVNACAPLYLQVLEEAVYDALFAASAPGYVANAPVNVAQIGGDAQSMTDLKDFADAGYDPSTNKVQGVVLVDTLTTYTGNTVQSGDAYARLGAPAGASVSADIADLPTVAEFEARTLLANGYFDHTTDEVIVGSLSTAAKAEVNAEVDGAIETYHLDHLFQTTYDPASKPGAADALLNELIESDAGVSRFTANALEQAPTGGSAPTAGEVADAVWTEILADHSGVAGSTAEALGAAGSAGDPWTTALPGSYTSGQAGKIIGDNINATISSRSSHSAADVWGVATRLLTAGTNIVLAKGTGVTGFNDLSAAQVNAEVDTALTEYDGPTNAQMEARTLLSASYGTSANQTTILARLGAWTGTGVNTILGAFKALLSKTASNPSDIGGTFDAATDSTEALRDRGDVAWVTADVSGLATAVNLAAVDTVVDSIKAAIVVAEGTVVTGTSNVQFVSDLTSTTDNWPNDQLLVFTTGPLAGQSKPIFSYTGSSKTFVVSEGFTGTPQTGNAFKVISVHVHTTSAVATAVWANATRVLTAGTNLAIPTATENADAYLARGVSNVENTADRHSVAAMVMIQTNASVNVAGDTLTAKKPSDDTTFQTYTLTASPGADPITGIS